MDLLELSQRLKQVRQKQNLTMEQLAQRCGLSKGFISQVENFRLTPSLKSLSSICEALGISLNEIFSSSNGEPECTHSSIDDATEIIRNDSDKYGMRYFSMAYRQTNRTMDPFVIEYRRCEEERPPFMHENEEFFFLDEGKVLYKVGDAEPRMMERGDCVYMKPNLPHVVRLADGCDYARAIVVYAAGKSEKPDRKSH